MIDPRMNMAAWYWLADDGRVYCSASKSVVTTADAGYLAFRASGCGPTAWPRDGSGNQTTAALTAVLSFYGLAIDAKTELIAYAAAKRYAKEIGGIVVSGIAIETDDRSKQMVIGARIAADADANFTTPWVAADNSVTTVNAAQIIGISNAVLAHVAGCFATFATVKAAIDAATMTTKLAVDAAFA